jgi:hypothetical protein
MVFLIKSDRIIRNAWLNDMRKFNVLSNAWKETLRDSFANIKANRAAAKEKVRKVIYKQKNYINYLNQINGVAIII